MNMVNDASSETLARMGSEETIWAAAGVLRVWIQEQRHPGGAVYGLEERVPTRSERQGAVGGSGAGDSIWAEPILPILEVIKYAFHDPFLSDNPSWDKGWGGYLAGKNSTQGGDR
jgi:hypothetical protein